MNAVHEEFMRETRKWLVRADEEYRRTQSTAVPDLMVKAAERFLEAAILFSDD